MSCFNFIIMKVNGTDVNNLAHEEAIQLFLNAREPIIVEVRRRGFEDSNKLSFFNYDTHMSPTLAVISSSFPPNTANLYEEKEYCKAATLKPQEISQQPPQSTSSISCQTELSAFNNGFKGPFFMRGDSDLNSGKCFPPKDYQRSVNVDALGGCLRTEYDLEEITLRKSQSSENLGFTINYATEEFSDSDSCSDVCVDECKDISGTREGFDLILSDFPPKNCKVYISDIVPNSPADHDGRLHKGDRVLQINGRNVAANVDLNKLLTEHKHCVTILVSRSVYAGDDEFLDSAVYCDDKECPDELHQSSTCDCEHNTYSSKSFISQSEQKNCSSTTLTNIYPVMPIAVENVSDLFNHVSIKAQLESVNKEISLLNSQIAIMKLQDLQSDNELKLKVSLPEFKSQTRNLNLSTSTEESTSKFQVSKPETESEHIYETIPEDRESEAYYCSPYEGVNDIRVEQWLESLGCLKDKTRSSGEKIKNNSIRQRIKKYNDSLDDYDNSSSAYNTGGSYSSAPQVTDQSNILSQTQPFDQLSSKRHIFKCKSSINLLNKSRHITESFASSANSNRTLSREPCTSSAEKAEWHRVSIPSTSVVSARPHTPDENSGNYSTSIGRPSSYKFCQHTVVTGSKDEELSEVVWKVKRRPDGSRYIVRRVTKKCTQVKKNYDGKSNENKKQMQTFKEHRQRNRSQGTLSSEKYQPAQHWLV